MILKSFIEIKTPLFYNLDVTGGATKAQRWEEFNTGNNIQELQTDKEFWMFKSRIRCKNHFCLVAH